MKAKKVNSERGANLVEFSLLIALVAVMGVASLDQVGKGASAKLEYLGHHIGGQGSGEIYADTEAAGCTAGAGGSCN